MTKPSPIGSIWMLAFVALLTAEACTRRCERGEPTPIQIQETLSTSWRFRVQSINSTTRTNTRACVAFALQKTWALTAAHCFPGRDLKSMHATMSGPRDRSEGPPWKLNQIIFHPELDLVLIEHEADLLPTTSHALFAESTAPDLQKGETLHLQTGTSRPSIPLSVIETHPPIALGRNETGCIQAGDSGAPLWTSDRKWAGVLIRGSPTCTGQQVFILVNQKLMDWMGDAIKQSDLP